MNNWLLQALRDAIRSVTDLDDNLTVEKIEIQTKREETQ